MAVETMKDAPQHYGHSCVVLPSRRETLVALWIVFLVSLSIAYGVFEHAYGRYQAEMSNKYVLEEIQSMYSYQCKKEADKYKGTGRIVWDYKNQECVELAR